MVDATRLRRGSTAGDRQLVVADDEVTRAGLVQVMALWAALVREARRHRGVTQAALASAVSAGQQTISKIERGQICPQDRLKLALALALQVDPADLFPWPPLPHLLEGGGTIAAKDGDGL